jgi:hypothetical protein
MAAPRLLPRVDLSSDDSFGNYLVQQTTAVLGCCAAPRHPRPRVAGSAADAQEEEEEEEDATGMAGCVGGVTAACAAPADEVETKRERAPPPAMGKRVLPAPSPPLPYSRGGASPRRSPPSVAPRTTLRASPQRAPPSPQRTPRT